MRVNSIRHNSDGSTSCSTVKDQRDERAEADADGAEKEKEEAEYLTAVVVGVLRKNQGEYERCEHTDACTDREKAHVARRTPHGERLVSHDSLYGLALHVHDGLARLSSRLGLGGF